MVPLPPTTPLTDGDKALAALLNVVDADMRSIDLGRWFVKGLRWVLSNSDIKTCKDVAMVSEDQLAVIADKVPGANEVTRREIRRRLRRVLDIPLCAPGYPLVSMLTQLDRMSDRAFRIPSGTLRGMPGYSIKSRLPLPRWHTIGRPMG